ncbi:RrF2 family transcriptional regulator [Deinococcus radiopugnans]|uniref:Rrf2 family protein n=1 Tax=Deinococcus radiopugnans ATCC 19172 TaxID=585398 RepID=A0A5C4Y9Y6_9DEIO|nr:Rrf2 family transcriptional regulator [Deinococcus radiopugnans]MBB6015968.1 Rrf2 family protein [Deinococcus radiopugnans ATCC 19172]TNM72343.1 Rrf2 family transcriptional regulator [Deinococcus radiopugnans ATCC 19172]
MKLSQGVEWCLHTVVLLGQIPQGGPLPRHLIARHHGLPDEYFAKYLKLLVKAGVLLASTGPRGGYRLARPGEHITAWEVVEAIEGDQSFFHCQEIRQCGSGAASPEECNEPCAIHQMMQVAFLSWKEQLSRTTVADLVGQVPEHVRDRNRLALVNA